MKKKDTVTYELKQKNKVVYKGTTKNPERRKSNIDKREKSFLT